MFWELNKKVRIAEKKLAAAKLHEATAVERMEAAKVELATRKEKTQLCLDLLADYKMD